MKKTNQDQLMLSISESTEGGFSQRSTHLRLMIKPTMTLLRNFDATLTVQFV